MAKHKAAKADDKPADGHDEVPSNTTSGGEVPEPADGPASVEGDTPKGVAHYPPSPSDSAGEKTDNIPPAKELPPDPPREGADPMRALDAQLNAMAAALRNLGIDPAPICEAAAAKVGGAKASASADGGTRKATVTPRGGAPLVVEFPADSKDQHAAAVAAYKNAAGVWSLPEQPHVEPHTA